MDDDKLFSDDSSEDETDSHALNPHALSCVDNNYIGQNEKQQQKEYTKEIITAAFQPQVPKYRPMDPRHPPLPPRPPPIDASSNVWVQKEMEGGSGLTETINSTTSNDYGPSSHLKFNNATVKAGSTNYDNNGGILNMSSSPKKGLMHRAAMEAAAMAAKTQVNSGIEEQFSSTLSSKDKDNDLKTTITRNSDLAEAVQEALTFVKPQTQQQHHQLPPTLPPPQQLKQLQQVLPPPPMQQQQQPPYVNIPLSTPPASPSPPPSPSIAPADQINSNQDITTTTVMSAATNSNNELINTNQPLHCIPCESTELASDVIHINEVEWADPNQPHHYPPEQAPKPKPKSQDDPCDCEPYYDEVTNTLDTSTVCCLDTNCVLYACQEECRKNCPAGDLCGNKRITRRQWKNVTVFDAGIKGRGLKVREDIKASDLIIEYTGVAIKRSFLDELFHRYRSERMLYIMALDNDVYIDARKRGGVARYINHSCEPNCVVNRWKVRGISRAGVFALRDIQAGEELAFDYKWKRKRGRAPTKCHCGTPSCRGTLEEGWAKSVEEEQLELQWTGHWKTPTNAMKEEVIINRTIKIYTEEDEEYFLADVCKYDSRTSMHCLIFKGDMDETWVDLQNARWLILDEQMEGLAASERENLGIRQQQHIKTKHYVIVQTQMKEKLFARHAVDSCQRYRVQISVTALSCTNTEITRPPDPSSEDYFEMQDEYDALQESLDGQAWKFNLTGLYPVAAREFLEKDIAEIEKEELQKSGKDETNVEGIIAGNEAKHYRHEIVVPQCVTDQVKSRLPLLRNNCKNADVSFVIYKAKTNHQTTKLVIQSADAQFASTAQIILWKEVLTLCNVHSAPKTESGLFKDLSFLGGEIPIAELQLLCSLKSDEEITFSQDCSERYKELASLTLFESTHRCTILLQSPEDVKIDSNNRDTDKTSFKVFFGCEPQRIPELWGYVALRLKDLSQGVKYFNMEYNKEHISFITKKFEQNSYGMSLNFLDYVAKLSETSISFDQYCKYHIRIECIVPSNGKEADRRINIAKELIHLQIELLKENQARQHRRGFGRDWSLIINEDEKAAFTPNDTPLHKSSGSMTVENFLSHCPNNNRDLSNAFIQIAEISDALGLCESGVAAQAGIILYRYLHIASQPPMKMKLRETLLACTFLANKSQKAVKWKRLDAVLDAAYKIFYTSGTKFDPNGEEAASWEKRILAAENEILKVLEYDIFWTGIDWIYTIARESGQIPESDLKSIVSLMQIGPVLAAGAKLWLKFGVDYVFTAVAALLSLNIDGLLVALSISPRSLIDAVKLITSAILSPSSRQRINKNLPEIFNGEKHTILEKSKQIENQYYKHNLTIYNGSHNIVGTASIYQKLARRSGRRRVFQKVDREVIIKYLLPSMRRIRLQSQCDIYIKEGDVPGTDDMILDGSWRSLALAESLLKKAASSPLNQIFPNTRDNPSLYNYPAITPAPPLSSVELIPEEAEIASIVQIQGKLNPCTIKLSSVDLDGEWSSQGDEFWKGKAGGKACLPANISSRILHNAGLYWRSQLTPCPILDGSLCSMLSLRSSGPENHLNELSNIAKTYSATGKDGSFPFLASLESEDQRGKKIRDLLTPVSLQRWPPEKSEIRERSKGGMGIGISATALQEMQILQQLHFLIPAPQGHPNFVLPIAIASDNMEAKKVVETSNVAATKNVDDIMTGRSDDLLSYLHGGRSKIEQEKQEVKGSYLVFEPIPLVLQRIISKPKNGKNGKFAAGLVPASVLTAWFYDLLSAMAHCHANHIVLRTLHPDQIFIDHSGIAKMSGLSRSITLSHNDRHKFLDPIVSLRNKGKKGCGISEEDILSNPYMAPELLLGGSRYSQETDIWTLGCMIAHLIVGKPIFSGRDRKSKMRAIFKIIGTPSSNNYKKAESFPYFNVCRTSKKYKRDVEKAMRFMLNSTDIDASCYSKILCLLDEILVLDPSKRLSAADALEHKTMTDFVDSTKGEEFRRRYIKDWVTLNDEHCSQSYNVAVTIPNQDRAVKRKAPLNTGKNRVNALGGLYDMGDIIAPGYPNGKRVKM